VSVRIAVLSLSVVLTTLERRCTLGRCSLSRAGFKDLVGQLVGAGKHHFVTPVHFYQFVWSETRRHSRVKYPGGIARSCRQKMKLLEIGIE